MADKHAAEAASLLDSFDDVSTRFERKLGEAKNSVDPKKLHELELLQKEWANFLQKGVKLEKEWGKEKTKDEKEYGKFVLMIKAQTRSSNAYKGQIDKIEKQGDGNAKKALAQLDDLYAKDVASMIERAETAISNMHHALVREFPKAAAANFRIAADILSKQVEPVLKNFDKKLAEVASKNGVTLEYLRKEAASELKKIESLAGDFEKKVKELDHHLGQSRDEIRAQEEEAKEKEAVSTDKNASKQYTKHLNDLVKALKDGYNELKKAVDNAQDASDEVANTARKLDGADLEHASELGGKIASKAEEAFVTVKKFNKDVNATFSADAIKRKVAKLEIQKADAKKYIEPVFLKAKALETRMDKAAADLRSSLAGSLKSLEKTFSSAPKSDDGDTKNADEVKKAITAVRGALSHAA